MYMYVCHSVHVYLYSSHIGPERFAATQTCQDLVPPLLSLKLLKAQSCQQVHFPGMSMHLEGMKVALEGMKCP